MARSLSPLQPVFVSWFLCPQDVFWPEAYLPFSLSLSLGFCVHRMCFGQKPISPSACLCLLVSVSTGCVLARSLSLLQPVFVSWFLCPQDVFWPEGYLSFSLSLSLGSCVHRMCFGQKAVSLLACLCLLVSVSPGCVLATRLYLLQPVFVSCFLCSQDVFWPEAYLSFSQCLSLGSCVHRMCFGHKAVCLLAFSWFLCSQDVFWPQGCVSFSLLLVSVSTGCVLATRLCLF